MIWFWFPGLSNDGISVLDPPIDMSSWNDIDLDYSTTIRQALRLRNPDWVADIAKPHPITIKRSMNNVVRSYITSDRLATTAYTMTLDFKGLHLERRMALEHFLACAEGKVLGYKDPHDKYHAVVILPEDITLTTESRAGGQRGKTEIEDEIKIGRASCRERV